MDPVSTLLAGFGVSVVSQVIYDLAKARIGSGRPTRASIARAISDEVPGLSLTNAEVVADATVDFLAKNGHIRITGTYIYGADSVWMRSAPGTELVFDEGSTSETRRSRISAGRGASMKATGGTEVEQDEEGNIIFRT